MLLFNINTIFNSMLIDSNSIISQYILIFFIIGSLYLTFYKNGNAIYKVIGLLLTSILIVFLWILQTQFLFIFLVYILAFISAVLMLFLSVVLMLPISMISVNDSNRPLKDYFWDNSFLNIKPTDVDDYDEHDYNNYIKNKKRENVPKDIDDFYHDDYKEYIWQEEDRDLMYTYKDNDIWTRFWRWRNRRKLHFLFIFDYSTLEVPLFICVAYLIIYIIDILVYALYSNKNSYLNVFYLYRLSKRYFKYVYKYKFLFIEVTLYVFYIFESIIIGFGYFSLRDIPLVVLITCLIVYMIDISSYMYYTNKIPTPNLNFFYWYRLSKHYCKYLYSYRYQFIEIIIQCFIFSEFIISVISQFSVINYSKVDVLVEEKVLGLGVLKDLLYSSYPLFLIFSTIILLIALIGSALMVKKIK